MFTLRSNISNTVVDKVLLLFWRGTKSVIFCEQYYVDNTSREILREQYSECISLRGIFYYQYSTEYFVFWRRLCQNKAQEILLVPANCVGSIHVRIYIK